MTNLRSFLKGCLDFLKDVWLDIKIRAQLSAPEYWADIYKSEEAERYNIWRHVGFEKADSKVVHLTPAVKRRALIYRSTRKKKNAKK